MNKLKLLLTLGLLVAATNVMGYTITVAPVEIKAGQSTNLVINLNNAENNLTAYQMKLFLPDGVTVQKKSNGRYAFTANASRHDGDFSVSVKDAADGSVLISCFSEYKDALSGTDGELMRLPIDVASTVTTSLQGSIKEIEFTSVQAQLMLHADVVINFTMKTDAVTLAARSYTREYGEENPNFGYEVTSGTITSGTPIITCSATKTSPVGTYPIVISQGSVSNSNVTLVNGTLTITKAPLTVSVGNYTKVEGEANPEFTPTFSGFKNNETKSVLTKQPTVTCSATTSSPAGTYPVTVSGAEAQNYSFNYVNGTLTVTKRDDVTITAKDYFREYGEENPTFDYEVTSGTITSGTPEITCSATKTSPVGTYPIVISQGSVSNGNVTLVNGTLTITKAPLTVSVGNYTKVEGEANPEFTPTFSGFKNGETKSVLTKQPTVTCSATTSSPAGTYPVTVSGAEAQNYSFNYVNGTLTVTAKPVVGDNITFADAEVKAICVANWDTNGDGELSKTEAAAVTDIGTVFKNKANITSFDEFQYFTGVTVINSDAFYHCTKLVSIKMPNSILTIKGNSFCLCSSLTTIVFPDNDGFSFESFPFQLCSALPTITLPKNLVSITTNPFPQCTKLQEVIVDTSNPYFKTVDGVVYSKSGDAVLIYPCGKDLSEYTILNGTQTIAKSAFTYAKNLQKINIPTSVKSIESDAFEYCYGLNSIDIPNSVTSIGARAFYFCRNLESVVIPSSVTSIANISFGGCEYLTSIKVESGNTVYDSRDNCNAIIKTGTNELITGCKNTVIPNTVTAIGMYAFFYRYNLTSITIPNSVKSIGKSAFYGCQTLAEVHSQIEEPFAIDASVFQLTSSGEVKFTSATLYVPVGTKAKYQATDGWKNFSKIEETGGGDTQELKDGDIFTDLTPEGIEMTFKVISAAEKTCQVGEGNYDSAAAVSQETTGKVTIPEYAKGFRVITVGNYAFNDCDHIEELVYANTITHIGSYSCISFHSDLKTVVFPDNDGFTIGTSVYQNCSKLTKLSFTRGLKEFQGYPFYNCPNIREFTVAADNPYFKSEMGILWSKDGKKLVMYPSGKEGTEYHVANGVEELGVGAFERSSLVTITLPESVVKIGREAFEDCYNLENITLPSSLTEIPNYAFAYDRSLKQVTIPQSVSSIGLYAFFRTALKSVEIPSGVKSIGQRAFCSDYLTDVTSNIQVPFSISDNTFQRYDDVNKEYVFTSATLHVPVGTKSKYEATAGWKNFTKIVETGGEEPAPEIVRNVVMEEATGTWCGWCIRGFVAMKQAKEQFGDRFIGIAVHGGDVMDIDSYYDLGLSSYPSCLIDRDGEEYDPSYLYVVENRMKVAPTAGVSVKGEWNSDKTRVTATSETQFLADGDGYSMAYVLLADGLTGTSNRWNQNNAYSGRTSTDPDLQYYCNQDSPITDMVYNDVMVGSSYDSSGQNLATSFGGSVKKGDKKSNSYTLSLPTTGELAAAIDKNQVYVVAIVTNPDGTIANAAKAKVGTGAKGDVNADGTVDVADIATVISVMAKGGTDLTADVNGDGVVDVADIATIISEMAARARMLNEAEE